MEQHDKEIRNRSKSQHYNRPPTTDNSVKNKDTSKCIVFFIEDNERDSYQNEIDNINQWAKIWNDDMLLITNRNQDGIDHKVKQISIKSIEEKYHIKYEQGKSLSNRVVLMKILCLHYGFEKGYDWIVAMDCSTLIPMRIQESIFSSAEQYGIIFSNIWDEDNSAVWDIHSFFYIAHKKIKDAVFNFILKINENTTSLIF